MLLAEDLLRPGYQHQAIATRDTADGFYAETEPDGTLRHFGFYRKGEPRGWVMDRDSAVRTSTRTPGEETNPDEWLRDMVETIYREAEAEHTMCAFCHKGRTQVATLIAGPDQYTYICDECVDTCARIVAEQRESA